MRRGPEDTHAASDAAAGRFELPAELKAFEARLASLTPCAGRLDREALIFEAGRASVLPGGGRSASGVLRRLRWSWPTAFGAMTTVAAALLAMVLMRPEPSVVVRYVRVPPDKRATTQASDERHGSEAGPSQRSPNGTAPPVLVRDDPREPGQPEGEGSDRPRVLSPRPATILATVWFPGHKLEMTSLRRRELEAMLAQDIDIPLSTAKASVGDGGSERAAASQPYWQLRDELLRDPAWRRATSDELPKSPAAKDPLRTGTNS
ncbi:MAG: hypothetical protein JXB62_23760 [Pirellulales bacterium]|nr:hypothetical protein [Pirellulales bacterium]